MDTMFKASIGLTMMIAGLFISAFLLGMGGFMICIGITAWGTNGGAPGVLIGAGLLLIFLCLVILPFVPRGYRLTSTALIVCRWGPKVVIPLAEIRELRRVKLTKVNKGGGVKGFFGEWGPLWTADLSNGFGNFTGYITRNDTEVAIYRNKGEVIVLSPDQPDEFIRAVMERLSIAETKHA